MNAYDVAWQLSDLLETEKVLYVRTEPEVLDHTQRAPGKLLIHGQRSCLELEVTPENVIDLVGLLDCTIFDREQVPRLYAWNFKSLATYAYAYLHKYLTPSNSLIDLKIIEAFLGERRQRPENLVEAINRTKLALTRKGWESLYRSLHLPLALRVLPALEATPLLDEENRQSVFPCYEIEGQANGRLNCLKKFSRAYMPHNLGPDARRALKPVGYKMRFVYADYRYCEVKVLQWLSGDQNLAAMLDGDAHARIYQEITGDSCDSDTKRKIAKLLFLPVMYGCGAKTLAGAIGVSEEVASELIGRIRVTFPEAWTWMARRQEEATSGEIRDMFGRPRLFTEPYKARDFVVQAAAATFCQDRLVALHRALDGDSAYLVYSVHDGYGMVCRASAARQTYQTVKDVLEAESPLCPGLRLKVEIKFGLRLNDMRVFWRD